MSEQSGNSFHPMNEPYISYGNRNIRKAYHTIAYQPDIVPSYESQSLLKHSQLSNGNNYPKQIYSQSSTNLNMQSYDLTDSQVRVMSKHKGNNNKNERNSLQYSMSQQNNNNARSVPSINMQENHSSSVHSINQSNNAQNNNNRSLNNSTTQQQQQQQQQQQSTQLLHEKIYFLQKQLQQLTRILQQQSKHSYSGQQYEQIAIENAQLTIRVQQLEEEVQKISTEKLKTEGQLLQLGQQYQKSHRVNNQLRQRVLQLQQRITVLEKNSLPTTVTHVQSSSSQMMNNINNNFNANNNNTNTNTNSIQLQQQNTRLTQQIQTLLTKLHNLNIQFNDQQQSKQELMQKMNQQLLEIEKLRKQLSDYEVEKLQLQEMNQYLKQEIGQVNTISLNKLKEIQEKYIKEDMQRQYTQQQLENFNIQLQHRVQQLQNQLQQLHAQNQQLNIKNQQLNIKNEQLNKKKPSPYTPPKTQPFKDLFNNEQQQKLNQQITLLNQQLIDEKQRHQVIKTQYTEMLHNRQIQINQLETQNRTLLMENRTLKIQIEDRSKQIMQLKEQCNRVSNANANAKDYQMKLGRNLELNNNSNKFAQAERLRYEENIRTLNQQNKRLLEEKQQLFRDYQFNIRKVEDQLSNTKFDLQRLSRTIQIKQEEIRQKDYLAHELLELQKSHEQLIQEVKSIKKSKQTLQQEIKQKEENLKKNQEGQLMKYKRIIDEKFDEIKRLQLNLKSKDEEISQLKQQNGNLTEEIRTLRLSKKQPEINILPPPQQKQPQFHSFSSCPLCPEILKQFNIYKQLMQLKFQTMNEMLDQMKISFIRAQFQMKDQINKDKSRYEHWIQKYDMHDKQYMVLMERLWEWEKINARNEMVRNDVNIRQGRSGSMSINNGRKGYENYGNIRKNSAQLGKKNQPAGHLSDLQYDLYLIKLQNSTLRSQISNLEKQLTQKGKGPETQRRIQQLKKYSDNLLSENEELKNRLTQIVSQKKISSSKNLSNFQNNQQGKNVSIFQRYSSQNFNGNVIENSRSQEKALASAELFINKLKKQNDNLIEAKRLLQDEIDQQTIRNRSLMKELQFQRQKYRREQESRAQSSSKMEVLDRYNLPIEYIKYHPQHKKLQTQYVALKRSYLEMELQYKKSKESLEQDLQKLKIENDFHQQRINELQKSQKSTNIFSFNHKFNEINNGQQSSEKQKALQERYKYLENQLKIKQKQCESYVKKYESLMKQMAFNPKTPRKKTQSIDRIDRITQNIEVSPIQSPQWQQNSAQQNSDRLFEAGQVSFDQKSVQKLRISMDKKMIELEITPRETSNLVIKATWFIERLFTDIKELRNNNEILKGQRKAIMKERNDLKEKLQDIDEVSISDRSKPFAKNKTNKTQTNHVLDESINTGLNKIKISKGYQSVPKLDFHIKSQSSREENIEGDQNVFNDVIKQTLQLKNQRRSGLKKFQQQVQKLTYN